MSDRFQGLQAPKTLLIESDTVVRQALRQMLEVCGHTVTSHATGEQAIPAALRRCYHLVICNQHLSGICGLDFFAKVHFLLDNSITVLTAALADETLFNRALALGVKIFMEKPFKIEHLLKCIGNQIAGGLNDIDHKHLYITNWGRVISIDPSEKASIPSFEKIRPVSWRRSINRRGRQWDVLLNHDPIGSTHGRWTPAS